LKKVVRIIARLNMGGPARHCMLLGHGLRDHGYETVLLAGDLDAGEVPLEGSPNGGPGFRIVHVPGLGRPPSPRDDLRALLAILRILRRERPDIVHTHTAKAGALGRLAARLAGVPVVVHTFHGHVLSGYFSPVRSHLVTLAERALARITARIITLSPRLRHELAGRYRIGRREQFEVMPLGRDLAPFQGAARGRLRRELGLAAGALLVGCVGRLAPIKRVPLLVRSFATLAARNSQAHLVIVGDGTERARVEAAIGEAGLTDRVHLLGWRRDLAQIYADLDLLALSSRNEGTPLAIVEAFASGVPVVATAVGGVPDMFQGSDGVSPRPEASPAPGVWLRPQGALVPADDPIALGEALSLLGTQPRLRVAAAEAARTASSRYRAERLVDEVGDLYGRLLREAGR
jgi:glycosyltransferase involved in cell wall biosynthesis